MLPLGRSPKLSAQLERMTNEMDQLDRELDADEIRKRMTEEFDRQVRKYVRRFVTEQEQEESLSRVPGHG